MDCTCIDILHDHKPGKCSRKGETMGGICKDCRYYSSFPERKA